MLPGDRVARPVDEAFELAQRLGQHRGVVLLADDPVPLLSLCRKHDTYGCISNAKE